MSLIPSLSRFSPACPYLKRTPQTVLKSLAATQSALTPGMSGLTARAYTGCPIMGPALAAKAQVSTRGYAAVAGQREVEEIHKVSRGLDVVM